MDSALLNAEVASATSWSWLCHVPGPPLSGFVEMLWLYRGQAPGHARERLLPDGSVELIINLLEDRSRIYDTRQPERFDTFPGTLISGAHSEPFVIDTISQAAVMGVHFRPGGAFPFLGLPAGELHNRHVSLEAVWGPRAAELRERLLEARTPGAMFRILERRLWSQATRPLARHPAVDFGLRELGRVPQSLSVGELTDRVGLSSRRFIQLFTEQVGLTPKLYGRVRRFQGVLSRVGAAGSLDWGKVALDCGYYDQAHFIHDFRDFSGMSPTGYLARRTEHRNHVPLEASTTPD